MDDVRLDEMRIEAIEVLLREAGLALELHPSGEEGEPRFVATIVRPGTARELAFAGFGATRAEAVAAVWRTFADAFSRVFGWGQPTPQAQQPEAQGRIERAPRRTPGMRTPQPVDTGLYLVDATWGSIGPIEVAPGVRTVGELEVIDHIEHGGQLVDTRREPFYRGGTIPSARWIPHDEIVDRLSELDQDRETIYFCNGPQCTATRSAIRALLDVGVPAARILYYRGGIHDWLTLGLPIVAGKILSESSQTARATERSSASI